MSKYISPRSAQTGSASEGELTEDAFIAADNEWRLFRQFHEVFGDCARVQNKTTESMKLWQRPGTIPLPVLHVLDRWKYVM